MEKTGLVVDGTNVNGVTEALERLLAEPKLRHRMGQAGRRHAQGFDWPKVVQRTVELVEKVE